MHLFRASKEGQDRTDLGLALSFGLVNFIFLLSCWHIIGVQSDESLNIYGALRIMDGERIYRDFWVYYTPGIFYLTTAVMATVGKSLSALRLILILASSVTAGVLYLIGRKFMSRGPALVSSALFVLVGVNLWPVAVQHWYSTFSLILCVFFVIRYLEDGARLGSLAAGGLMASLTFLLQQQKGGMLMAMIFLFLSGHLLMRKEKSLRRLVRVSLAFGVGVGAPILLAGLLFWHSATLNDAISATIVFPLTHLSSGNGGFMSLYGWLTRSFLLKLAQFFEPHWIGQNAAIATSLIINVVAPLSVPIGLSWWLFDWFRSRPARPAALFTFLAGLICLVSSLQRPDFYHLLSNSPLTYLSIGYVAGAVAPVDYAAVSARMRRLAFTLMALIILIPPVFVAAAELMYSSRIQKLWLGSNLGFLPLVDGGYVSDNSLKSLVEYIQMNTQPEDRIFVIYSSPFIYYLCDRKNPTAYPVLAMSPCVSTGNLHLLDLSEGPFFQAQTNDAIEAVEAAATPVVILDPAALCLVSGDSKVKANPLAKYLNDQFHPVGNFGDCIVLHRNQRDD